MTIFLQFDDDDLMVIKAALKRFDHPRAGVLSRNIERQVKRGEEENRESAARILEDKRRAESSFSYCAERANIRLILADLLLRYDYTTLALKLEINAKDIEAYSTNRLAVKPEHRSRILSLWVMATGKKPHQAPRVRVRSEV